MFTLTPNILGPAKSKDAAIALSAQGRKQAEHVGLLVNKAYIENALIYCSPYKRTRETLDLLLKGAGIDRKVIKTYEVPRLREIDVGYGNPDEQLPLRRIHGWFYYRFEGGESPADCYDRTSNFLESLMRQKERSKKENILIICHGMTLRCFVTRFLHLTVEQFESMDNPSNCDIVTIGKNDVINNPVFSNNSWGLEGIQIRTK